MPRKVKKEQQFDIENSDPQPGTIEDQAAFDDAVKSGKTGVIESTVEAMEGTPAEGVQLGPDDVPPVKYPIDEQSLDTLKDETGAEVDLPAGGVNDPPETIERKPNIIFVGKRVRNGKTEPKEAARTRRSGLTTWELPPDEVQRNGFYHPDANRLIRAFPADFKQFVEKGD